MDSIDFGGLFAFTAIAIYTREADVCLAPELTAGYGLHFLHQSMSRRFDNHVHLIQTDGGPEFKLTSWLTFQSSVTGIVLPGLTVRTSKPT